MPPRTWRDDLAKWPPPNPLLVAVGAERFSAHTERGERLVMAGEEVSRFQILMDEAKALQLRLALGLIDEMLDFMPGHLLSPDWERIRDSITWGVRQYDAATTPAQTEA